MKHLKKLIFFVVIATFFLGIGYFGIYTYAKITPELSIKSANGFYFYDQNGELFTGNGTNSWVSLDDISDNLINATISIEDKNFFKHKGFDFLRIGKAMYTNIINHKTLQGASTISQQYIKNLFLDFDKTWKRKLEEAWLTIRLESHYTKEEILEGYLNTINYGGIFGIENASQYYFNKSSKDLTLAEASMLAGIPKWPSKYSPLVDEEAAKNRQLIILKAMVSNNYITEEEKNEAYNTTLNYTGKYSSNSPSSIMYYQDAVIDELKSITSIPTSFLSTGGLKVYTNLDIKAQKTMEESINNNLSTNPDIEVASIAVEPNSGKIIALIGGRDYSKSQFNRAINAKRQMGSTIKPFLYYSALENGFTPSTTFTSEKTTFTFGENKTYSPKNYGEIYANSSISLAAAISYSDNIYAVKTHLFLGEDALSEITKRVGISDNLEKLPSTALGTEELSLMDMITGYTVLANEGNKIKPYLITKVEDVNGNVLYEYVENKDNVLNKSIVYVLNSMLNNCYSSDMIDYNYPTCINIASKLTKKYAIKTGTTNTDNLIFGYNNDLLVGVWMGYDNNKETDSEDSRNVKNIWADTIENYLKEKEDKWYKIPDNVVGVVVNPITGELATNSSKHKKILYYIKGTEPTIDNNTFDNLIPTIKLEE